MVRKWWCFASVAPTIFIADLHRCEKSWALLFLQYIYACVYTYVFMCVYVHLCVCLNVCVFISVWECVCENVCTCSSVCVNVCVWECVHLCVCMNVCACECVCAYVCAHTPQVNVGLLSLQLSTLPFEMMSLTEPGKLGDTSWSPSPLAPPAPCSPCWDCRYV